MQGSQRRVRHVLRHPGKRQAACCRKLRGAECHEVLHLAAYSGWCELEARQRYGRQKELGSRWLGSAYRVRLHSAHASCALYIPWWRSALSGRWSCVIRTSCSAGWQLHYSRHQYGICATRTYSNSKARRHRVGWRHPYQWRA